MLELFEVHDYVMLGGNCTNIYAFPSQLQDKLSQEAALRALLEEEQSVLLLTVQDMKNVVDEERTQVGIKSF